MSTDDSTPFDGKGWRFWLRGREVQPGVFTSGERAAGRVDAITPQDGGYFVRITGEQPGEMYAELPANVPLPFAVGDTIAIRQHDSVKGIHPQRDFTLLDAHGEVLACQVQSGDHSFVPGWQIAVRVESDKRAAVHLTRRGRSAILRGLVRRLAIDGERWIVTGNAHVITPGRPLVPDETNWHAVSIVRDLSLRVVVREPDGRTHEKTFVTRADADAYANDVAREAVADDGRYATAEVYDGAGTLVHRGTAR